MSLDVQLAAWFERLGREFGPLPDTGAPARRQRYEEIGHLLDAETAAEAGVATRDLSLPLVGRSLNARLYETEVSGGRAPGLLVFFHGGGWVLGSLPSHDALCRRIAARSGVVVVSVDYRLAPEHPFPAPCEDAIDATLWLVAHAADLGCDPTRVAVGGDSAGGHLAAVTALAARDAGVRLDMQWLIYPTIAPDPTLPSYAEFGKGPGLTVADMAWFWQQFLADSKELDDYRVSPAAAASLAGTAPAYVVVAGLDLLRDEGERYATMLQAAGVPTQQARAPGMTHGYARLFPVCDAAARHVDTAIAALKEALA